MLRLLHDFHQLLLRLVGGLVLRQRLLAWRKDFTIVGLVPLTPVIVLHTVRLRGHLELLGHLGLRLVISGNGSTSIVCTAVELS